MEKLNVEFKNLRQMLEKKAGEIPQKVYVYFYDDVITYGDFNRMVDSFASGLSNLGVKKGDIVHVYMNNSIEVLIANFAINKLGGISGPINCWWQAGEIEYLLNDSKGRFLIVDSCYLPTINSIRKKCPNLEFIIENGEKVYERNIPFSEIKGDRIPDVEISDEDVAYLFYTSGTTGKPKGVLLTHGGILYCIEGIRKVLEPKDSEEAEKQNALIFLPLFHVNAMMSMISIVYRGISATLRRSFSATEFGEVVQRYKPTFFSAVPMVYNILLQLKDMLKNYDLSSLKYGICGAAPMPVELFKKFEEAYNITIIEGYGLTEGTVASTMNPREGVRKIGSIGQAIAGQEVKVFDEDGGELPAGEVGEIVIRGKNVMLGYLGKDEETKETLKDGWLHTGDIGYRDEDGYFFIVDRKKELIIRGGENIYPKEIENLLFENPKVLDVAVIGVPDEIRGEEVKAFIILKQGQTATEDEIRNFCRERLAEFKVPRYIEFTTSLPKNIIGKVLKKELKRMEMEKRKIF